MCGVIDGSENVLSLEKRIIFQNFFKRRLGAKKLQYIRDAHTQAPNARTAPTLTFFNRDSLKARQIHIVILRYQPQPLRIPNAARTAWSAVPWSPETLRMSAATPGSGSDS